MPLINVATVAFQTFRVPHNYKKSYKLNLLNNTAFLTCLNFNLVTVSSTSPSHTSFFFYFLLHTHFSVYFHLLTCCMSPSLQLNQFLTCHCNLSVTLQSHTFFLISHLFYSYSLITIFSLILNSIPPSNTSCTHFSL